MSSDALLSDFQWKDEYADVLKQIVQTDTIEVQWDLLKNIIRYQIQRNIRIYLSDMPSRPLAPSIHQPVQLQNGGLRLPPFPPRQQNNMNMIEAPKSYMNEQEANVLKESIFAQLDTFDEDPPFTIQRLCELLLSPDRQYRSVGKYLRAVEKSILVTSTHKDFPPLTDQEKEASSNLRSILSSGSESVPNTPLFSPIPFLHKDARRSQSRSPPPSPLALSAAVAASGPVSDEHAGEPPALGLVDELDDPRPGHMSEHPTALSAVTTVDDGKDGVTPIVQSLEERFVKAETEEVPSGHENSNTVMTVDEKEENKENQST